MFKTQTGNFPIGVRRGWTEWQSDLTGFTSWAKDSGFSVVDLGSNVDDVAPAVQAGLKIGSVDLLSWGALLSSDSAKRADALAKNTEYIAAATAAGAKNFFCVMLPEDASKPRTENFGYVVEALNGLAPVLEQNGGKLVIEGYPGAGALCCTPETYRAAFKEAPSNSIGINYDPSHLLRMGIDPIRFLKEFSSRVFHVHGKDAELLTDDLYEYGWEQPATFKKNPAFGATAWRYTIPGQGNTPWGEVFRILSAGGYSGAVSIELEDRDYNGSEEGEKRGILAGANFLSAC
jgi:sugar phosphate isomerase/epimerase